MTVAIIDYGSGNLRSAAKAFERAGREHALDMNITVTANAADVAKASHLVLPGVGAFADCRQGLRQVAGMTEAVLAHITAGKPFLGICVGMQLLADAGLEHGYCEGFGLIAGEVVALSPASKADGQDLKIPHMGWNQLQLVGNQHPVFAGLEEAPFVYFVHGFHFQSVRDQDVIATTEYGQTVTAAIGRDNMVGVQFHPEKSQASGLRLIANFMHWSP